MSKEPSGTPFNPDEWERVGATVRAFREMRGYTPEEFATSVGISRPYLVNIEAGRKKLTNVLLARMADALRVPQVAIMFDRPEVAQKSA